MTYTEEQVREATLEYFKGDDLATNVWMTKYALRNNDGEYVEKTPDDMHDRIATEFARIEQKYPNPMSYDEIRGLLDRFKYIIPQGSPMFGIGNNYTVQSLGNCFVVQSPWDSYGGILKSDQELAQLMKRRAGVGLDISSIRPKGQPTSNAARTTDGIGVFMERFSNTCREVAQNGRRGALMISVSVHHPEIETFINIKRDLTKVTGANISIRLTDEFMKAVEADEEYEQRWPVDIEAGVSRRADISTYTSAKRIWDQIIDSAWESAEPGLLFWDRVEKYSPAEPYGAIDPRFYNVSTNPCGEIPMGQDSCRLMLLNLTSFVKNPFEEKASFDYGMFGECAQKAQRLMDDLIDLELEKIGQIIEKIKSDPEPDHVKKIELELWQSMKETCEMGRRTGLGITGLGDTLAMLGVTYGSEESIRITDGIYMNLASGAYYSSAIMASERGAFPIYDPEIKDSFLEHLLLNDDGHTSIRTDKNLRELFEAYGRRNIACLTTAPAGSVSILAQTTSGCEPVFMLSYKRRRKVTEGEEFDFVDDMGDKWKEFTVYHHGLTKWMAKNQDIAVSNSPYYGATANEIDWLASVKLQAAAQKWVDHAISKTCNLPNDATRELVSDVYMEAWKQGCKGFTVYRDGCRSGVLVSVDTEEKQKEIFPHNSAPPRPEELPCEIHHSTVKGEKWTIFVGLLDGKPYEVFGGRADKIELPRKYDKGLLLKHPRKTKHSIYDLIIGNGDRLVIKDIIEQFDNPNYGTHTRLVSLALRHGASVEYVVSQLQKDKNSDMFGFSRVLARVLKKFIPDGTSSTGEKVCLSCGAESLIYQDGCVQCVNCGASKCG